MNKIHLKKLGLMLCLMAAPFMAHAASLGKLSVYSSLGEPLNAEIDVFPSSEEELDSLAATLASDAAYREQGVEKAASQADVRLSVAKKEDGSVVIKLNTAHPVSDAFLDLIVALNWKDGNLVREYTLLLDLPGQSSAVVDAPNVDAPKPITDKTADLAKEASNPITVKSGDSLAMIAKRLQVNVVNLDQLVVALYLENKNAFEGDNINRLKAGAVLKVPSPETLSAISPEDAQKEIQAHAADWVAYKNKLAGLAKESVATNDESNAASSGKVATNADEKALPSEAGSRDVVKLSKSEDANAKDAASQENTLKDDLAAKQNTIADTEEKTGVVEKQIAKMKQLLAIKNQSLANTQQKAEQSANGSKMPEVVTLLQTIPNKVKLLAGFVVLLVLVMLALRRRAPKQAPVFKEEPAQTPAVDSPTANASESEEVHSVAVEEVVPQIKSFDLSSIILDFEPVVTPLDTGSQKVAEPIPDAFSGDFSNLLKVEAASSAKSPKAPSRAKSATKAPTKTADFSDVETKLELAIAYIDMRDKRGAKKLLNEVLKEGDESQKARAQALIDQLK